MELIYEPVLMLEMTENPVFNGVLLCGKFLKKIINTTALYWFKYLLP